MPELTILISTFNCGKYISQAIESIFEQSYKDFEIIIIDDGSTDNTCEIIRGYKGIRYFQNPVNVGISRSLNLGIDLAQGEYIARMDADDLMLGNRLEDQINFLKENPDYGMVGGWYNLVNQDGIIRHTVCTLTDHHFLKLALLFRNQFAQPTVTGRTELFKLLRYDETLICAEDHDLWIRFSKIAKITNIPKLFLSYRWHSSNTCRLKQKELKISILDILSRELTALNIEHSHKELALHAAVCFGCGDRNYFKDSQRKENLLNWYSKIFNTDLIKESYSQEFLIQFKEYILLNYCKIDRDSQ